MPYAPSKLKAATDRELPARLNAIFNTVVDGIITIDEKGIIETMNPAAERIFGHKAKVLIGKNVNRLMPPPWAAQHDNYILRYLKTSKARVIGIGREVRGLRKDGSTFPMYLSVSEVHLGARRIFTGIVRDLTERKRAEQAIAQASEDERRQLGQELHDGIGQQLTGVALLTKALQRRLSIDGHPAEKDAAEIAEMLGRILADMRRQAHGLYPVELERGGLARALEELSSSYRQIHGIHCGYVQIGKLPAMEKSEALHLYRVVQEATHNSVRHGQAKRICISTERSATMLTVRVEDDGRGIRLRKIMPGMGINIMRHRAGVLGATLEIKRGEKRGTVVSLAWPLQWAKK